MSAPARWSEVSPVFAGSSAALAIVQIHGDIEAALRALELAPLATGQVRLRPFGDFDRGVVARPASDVLVLMPHAGEEIGRRVRAWLSSAGLLHAWRLDPRASYPEAATLLEARMLDTLAHAASPLAMDLLLDQPRRWALAGPGAPGRRSRELERLLRPACVAAYGAPNIGKSSLLNALAQRRVAVVADEPGTTRDHVGVTLDLGGVVVRYVDTPGMQSHAPDPVQREAQEIARALVWGSDLVLLCADARHPFLEPPATTGDVLRLGLRADLGVTSGADICVSARSGEGIRELVTMVRERLVPEYERDNPEPWRFWGESED